ncbi:hypothetical protein LXL04_004746 [Taraxacum kok-saghyz]
MNGLREIAMNCTNGESKGRELCTESNIVDFREGEAYLWCVDVGGGPVPELSSFSGGPVSEMKQQRERRSSVMRNNIVVVDGLEIGFVEMNVEKGFVMNQILDDILGMEMKKDFGHYQMKPICWIRSHLNEALSLMENSSGRLLTIIVKHHNYLILKRDYSRVSNGIIARGLSTQKNPHLTKSTPKLPVSRINLTRVPNPFATREPGQPSVRRRGMTTTSHTDPDASLSLLRRIGNTSITRVVKDL